MKIVQQHWKRIFHYKDNTKRQEQENFIIEQNLKQNNNWGDYLSKKPPNTIRIYIQNINGLNIEDIEGNFDNMAQHMHEAQADIMCFQEHNLSTEKQKNKETINKTYKTSLANI